MPVPATPPRLVSRKAERSVLWAAVERGAGGHSATVLIGGEAGVGKSRLLLEFAAAARADGLHQLPAGRPEAGHGPQLHVRHRGARVRRPRPWTQPGDMRWMFPAMRQAEGRVHFAGEHTSLWIAWMNGALESSERAVQEVLAADAEPAAA